MTDHARAETSKECCGLLAGRDGVITRMFAGANAAVNPARSYEFAPYELFAAMKEMRAARLDFLGIYHSHPTGENTPSSTDIARAYYPDVAYFIVSPRDAGPRGVRAFSIRDGRAVELEIEAGEN
jgi:proteasome lid subunit RPN8/RPN11